MKRMKASILAIVCAIAMPALAAGQASDVSGKWEATFFTEQGPLPATMVLKKEGEKLTGTISSVQGEVATSGIQKGNEITLHLTLDTGNGPIDIAISGKQDGDSLTGTVDIGGQGTAQWAAKRGGSGSGTSATPPAAASDAAKGKAGDVTGTWALQIDTGAGTGSPSVTLKQEGEKLTGTYTGQMGERPVTGSVKGTAITFQFDAPVQGQIMTVVYSGTVDGDALKGTVKLGPLGEGTFTGKRK